jgi:hypothetical protein
VKHDSIKEGKNGIAISIGGTSVFINIIRSSRKTLHMRMDEHGNFTLKVPVYSSMDVIHSFLTKNEKWILASNERHRKYVESRDGINFNNGEMHLLFGRYYPLRIVDSVKCLEFDGGFLLRKDCVSAGRSVFMDFYTETLKRYVEERIRYLTGITGLRFSSLRIGKALGRWGSCTYENKLTFSWLLAMAPPESIDYVIIHELVHTEIKSHGSQFWQEVEKYVPDWRLRREWLRNNYDTMRAVSP